MSCIHLSRQRVKDSVLASSAALVLLGFSGPIVAVYGMYSLFLVLSAVDDYAARKGYGIMAGVKGVTSTPLLLYSLLVATALLLFVSVWTKRWHKG